AIPFAPTSTAMGAVAMSQSATGLHPTVLDATPSHCSTLTSPTPCGQPDPISVNDAGNWPSAGTENGFVDGVVIDVAAHTALIHNKTKQPTTSTTTNRRSSPDIIKPP